MTTKSISLLLKWYGWVACMQIKLWYELLRIPRGNIFARHLETEVLQTLGRLRKVEITEDLISEIENGITKTSAWRFGGFARRVRRF